MIEDEDDICSIYVYLYIYICEISYMKNSDCDAQQVIFVVKNSHKRNWSVTSFCN